MSAGLVAHPVQNQSALLDGGGGGDDVEVDAQAEDWELEPDNGKPKFSCIEAKHIILRHFGLRVPVTKIKELDSERDRNFVVEAESGKKYVLKVSCSSENIGVLEMQEAAWSHLRQRGLHGVPFPVSSIRPKPGRSIVEYKSGNLCRLVEYVEGVPLSELESVSDNAWLQIGRYMGRLSAGLQDFEHDASDRRHCWDLRRGEQVVRDCLPYIGSENRLACLKEAAFVFQSFREEFREEFESLRRSVIHGDCNDNNVITRNGKFECLIDYGDMCLSYTVAELAIACAYASMYPDPLSNIKTLVQAYQLDFKLTDGEAIFLIPLIVHRLCVSCSISSRNSKRNSENEYLQVNSGSAWSSLKYFQSLGSQQVLEFLGHCFPSVLFDRVRYERCWEDSHKPSRTSSGLKSDKTMIRTKSELDLLKEMRTRVMGSNISLLYEDPIHLVSGSGCYLVDEKGKMYLDAVNNVPHVGHSNATVAKAVAEAMQKLNTNTRYIRRDYLEYARDLLATFPPSLEVVYFCNSGSEASDLALRIAREFGHSKKKSDVVVMNGAYHGHTASTIGISPYEFKRLGGKGKPESTHVMPFPDTCRNLHLDGDKESKKVLEAARRSGRKVCAFICESLLSCGGQVILPQGYLKAVYANMKAAGAICIADEVQCGFGRSGEHFWAFQSQEDVLPDIVVLGESIGNGFPLSAVVTTRELADTSANGMEYFNTFGGCNAAIAAGHSVLKVLKEENLQENAKAVGRYLLQELKQITKDCDFMGDVRGLGLFLGIEFVISKEDMLYAPNMAKFIANVFKKRCVLVSTDGMFENVIKIKPPVCFTMQQADTLLRTLRTILEKDLTDDLIAQLREKDLTYNENLKESDREAQSSSGTSVICAGICLASVGILAMSSLIP
ncbi:class-III aminotransferase [Chloropicon primus]|nr:class-III aminotransferase [Chloropicon primus]